MHDIKSWIGYLAFLWILQFEIGSCKDCPNACGTPSGLPFCSNVVFPVCQTNETWLDQDLEASLEFSKAMKRLNEDNVKNASHPCYVSLQKLFCAVSFPICEIGTEATRLCKKECSKELESHCPQLLDICISMDEDLAEGKSECFPLNYSGPAVGMWIAGFSISLVFSVLNSLGINLQKYSLSKDANAKQKRKLLHQPLWILGFTLICLGSILDFVAFGMAPQTLLAPLAALSLVWNMFIAPIFHKEKITRRNIVATIIIFIGVTITVIYAGHTTPTYSLEDLLHLYRQPVMHIYMICVVVFLITVFICTKYIEKFHVYEDGLFHIICYGGMAGTFGGQSVLLAKSTVELVKSSLWSNDSSEAFQRFETYVIIAGMAICLISQISLLNEGLKRFDALVMVPVYQSFWILTSVLGGIMYFEEYISMTYTQTCMFPVGAMITLLGIVYLLQDRAAKSHHDVKYTELSRGQLTPIAAWDPDASDEESVQCHLDLIMEYEKEDPITQSPGENADGFHVKSKLPKK